MWRGIALTSLIERRQKSRTAAGVCRFNFRQLDRWPSGTRTLKSFIPHCARQFGESAATSDSIRPKTTGSLLRAEYLHWRIRVAARTGVQLVRIGNEKSFYTGQCPEWGHPLDEALIVRWIGLHFFFSFELSYLKAPRKPRLDVARWPARKPLAVRSFIVQNGPAWS